MKLDRKFHHARKGEVPDVIVRTFSLARQYAEYFPGNGLRTPGDQAELIAEHCYGMKPARRGAKGYDHIDSRGQRVQVKGHSQRRGPGMRFGIDEALSDRFDRLLVMLITREGWEIMYDAKAADVERIAQRGPYGGVHVPNSAMHITSEGRRSMAG
jgi:uncharacterized protein DUF6998